MWMRWVVVIALAGCARGDATEAKVERSPEERMRIVEARVEALERAYGKLAYDNPPPAAPISTDALLDNEVIKRLGQEEEKARRRLERLDGLVDYLGGSGVRGWWCINGMCGRTRRECTAVAERSLTADFKAVDASRCAPLKVAWCRPNDENRLNCEPRPCAGCTAVE